MSKDKQYITKTELQARGWSKLMIDRLAGAPDRTSANPRYRSAPEVKLYSIARVTEIESTEEFAVMKQKYDRRKLASNKAVETKIGQTRHLVDEAIKKIHVCRLDLDEVESDAIDERQFWYESTGREFYPVNIPEHVKARWMVNYIRHNLTSYDDELFNMTGKVGFCDEYERYREAVLTAISEVYPELQDECIKQMMPKAWAV